jgi:hypothetical protein
MLGECLALQMTYKRDSDDRLSISQATVAVEGSNGPGGYHLVRQAAYAPEPFRSRAVPAVRGDTTSPNHCEYAPHRLAKSR